MQSKKLLVICSAWLSLGLLAPVLAQTNDGGTAPAHTSSGAMSRGSSPGPSVYKSGMDRGGPTGSYGRMDEQSRPDARPGTTDHPSGAPKTDNISK
jgi:hypothetical protein